MRDELNELLDYLEQYAMANIDVELAEYYRPEQGVNQ